MRSERKLEIQREYCDMECNATGDLVAASRDGYFALATKAGYFQSSKVVYTTDRAASALNGVKMVKTDFCRDYHLLAHLESSLRRRDRGACVGQLYFLKRRLGVVRGWKCQV